MRGSPYCTSYSYADHGTLYMWRTFVELEAQVVYRLHIERPGAGYQQSES